MYLIYQPTLKGLKKISFQINAHKKEENSHQTLDIVVERGAAILRSLTTLFTANQIPYTLKQRYYFNRTNENTLLSISMQDAIQAIVILREAPLLKEERLAIEPFFKKIEKAITLKNSLAQTLTDHQSIRLHRHLWPHLQTILSFSNDSKITFALLNTAYRAYGIFPSPFDTLYLQRELEDILRGLPVEKEKSTSLMKALLSFSSIYHGKLTARLGKEEKHAPDLSTQQHAIVHYVSKKLAHMGLATPQPIEAHPSNYKLNTYINPVEKNTLLDRIRYSTHSHNDNGLIEIFFSNHAVASSEKRITEIVLLLSNAGVTCSALPNAENDFYYVALLPQHFRAAIECLSNNGILFPDDRAPILGDEGPMKIIEKNLENQSKLAEKISDFQAEELQFILAPYIEGVLEIATNANTDLTQTLSIFSLASFRWSVFHSAENDLIEKLNVYPSFSEENKKNSAEYLILISKALHGDLGLESTLIRSGDALPALHLQKKAILDFIAKKVAEKFPERQLKELPFKPFSLSPSHSPRLFPRALHTHTQANSNTLPAPAVFKRV